MSHNSIEEFETHAFENCVNMTKLDLSHNAIKTFGRNAFDELSYATAFLLSYNQLENMTAVINRSPLANLFRSFAPNNVLSSCRSCFRCHWAI